MIIEILILILLPLVLSLVITRNHPDWNSRCGQEHHAVGDMMFVNGIISFILVCVYALLGINIYPIGIIIGMISITLCLIMNSML
jgi:predicted Na+-dependent transporter